MLLKGTRCFSNRTRHVLSLLVLGTLLLIVFWPVLFEGRSLLPTDEFDTMTLPFSREHGPPQAHNNYLTDAMMQSYPWKVIEQKALRNGVLDYWNPLILTGYPQYASTRQTFDVFNALLIPFELPLAFNLIIVAELFVAGIGMYLLLSWHGIRWFVALLFAAGWMLNGMFLTQSLILWVTATFCWLPFAVAMLLRYYQKRVLSFLAFAAIFTALAFLGSTLQSAVYVIVVIATLSLYFARQHGVPIGTFLHVTLSVLAIGIALSAIMWAPSLEFLLDIFRHGWMYRTNFHGYTIGQRILSFALLGTFFVPELLGQVNSLSLTSLAGVHPLDFSGYVGFLEALMGLMAAVSMRKISNDMKGYVWLVLLGIFLPIFTPLFAVVYHRFLIVGTFGFVVAGAAQFDHFLDAPAEWKRVRTWLKPVLGLGCGIVLLLAALQVALAVDGELKNKVTTFLLQRSLGAPFTPGNLPWVKSRVAGTLQHFAITSPMMFLPFAAVFFIGLLLWNRGRWVARGWQVSRYVAVLFVLTIGPMVFWWRNWFPMTDTKQFPLVPSTPEIQFLNSHRAGYRVFVDRELYPDKQWALLDNMPSTYELPEISGYETEMVRSIYGGLLGVRPATPHPKALGLFAVQYLLYVHGIGPGGNLPCVDTSGGIDIYDNPYARPRATLVYSSLLLPNDTAVRERLFDESLSHNEVLFTPSLNPRPPLLKDTTSWEPATITSDGSNEVRIFATPRHRSFLVLSDTYYPGWNCYVDGLPAQIYRANYSMRAILLAPGSHRVVFRFEPVSYRIGAAVSGLALLVVLGMLASVVWRREEDLGR